MVLAPAHHWSARGIYDINEALWASVTIKTPGGNIIYIYIYLFGGSGYGNGSNLITEMIKNKFEKFRLALLPMYAYIPREMMNYFHMDPEEMIIGFPFIIPSHYNTCPLGFENFNQAVEDFVKTRGGLRTQKQNDGKQI